MIEKIAAIALSNFYKQKELLYKGQFKYRKHRNMINIVVKLILATENA